MQAPWIYLYLLISCTHVLPSSAKTGKHNICLVQGLMHKNEYFNSFDDFESSASLFVRSNENDHSCF